MALPSRSLVVQPIRMKNHLRTLEAKMIHPSPNKRDRSEAGFGRFHINVTPPMHVSKYVAFTANDLATVVILDSFP